LTYHTVRSGATRVKRPIFMALVFMALVFMALVFMALDARAVG